MAHLNGTIALGPSPNWYFSHVSDSNRQNVVAYGARSNIIVVNFEQRPPVYLAAIPAHKDRVTALAFCRYKRPNILASGSEDGIIRVWDIFKKKYFYQFQSEEKILCISWQEGTDQVIFASTDQGNLYLLNLLHDTTTYLKCGTKSPVIVLASCPNQPNLLATGHKGGAVIVLDVTQGHIIHKLKGHEDDILSLSWRPSYDDQLVSTGRDRTLRIWDIVKEKAFHILHIPQSSSRGGKGDEHKIRPWLCTVCCPDGKLISSTFSGNLVLWDLENEKQKWEILHTKDAGGHNKCVFNISICDPDGKKLCTISLDRQVIIWDLQLKKSELVLPTLGGFAFCLSFSPLDVGRLAVGSGDLSIRIWNVAISSSASVTTTLWQGIKGKVTAVAWHPEKEGLLAFGTEEGKIGVFDVLLSRPPTISSTFHKHTVYTVAWGPCIINQGIESNSSLWYLYSCGDGVILIHNISQPHIDALNLDDLLQKQPRSNEKIPQRTEIAWKPDFSRFAVGNDDGSIEIYCGRNFILVAHLLVQKKLIQCLCWHPLYTALSSEQSKMHMWLASASTESAVHIFDLTDVLAETQDSSLPVATITRSTRQLVGHRFRVVSLVWNPHVDGRLASASYDGTVQVWDALLGQPVANYRGHQGRVYCVEWSLLDPDVIFSGGEDCTVQQWRVSEQPHRLPPSKQEAAKQKKNLINGNGNLIAKQKPLNGTSHGADGLIIETEELNSEITEKNTATQKQQIFDLEESTCSAPVLQSEGNLTDCKNYDMSSSSGYEIRTGDMGHLHQDSMIKLKKPEMLSFGGRKSGRIGGYYPESRKKKKTGSLFPVTSAAECRGKSFAQEDCRILADYFSKATAENCCNENLLDGISAVGDGSWIHLGLFVDQESALRMLNNEAKHHQEVDNVEYAQQLGVWTGNIGNVINKAIERSELSDWLVSLAPLASYSLWKEACKKYACQLVKEGNFHKAVLYLLVCHDVTGAIQVLKEHVSYREALALAKSRLPSSDPLIKDLLSGWATRADRDGNYELAAKCYLAKQQPMSAAKVLSKQSDPSASRLAAYIAHQCGNFTEAEAYSLVCLKDSLLKHNWALIKEMIQEQPFLEDFKMLISVHEALTIEDQKITANISNFGFLASSIQKYGSSNEIVFWKNYCTEDSEYYPFLINLLDSGGYLHLEKAQLELAYNAIVSLAVDRQTPHTSKEMLFQVAVDLSLAILSSLILDMTSVIQHLTHAICTCYDASCLSILNTIFVILIPADIIWKKKLQVDEMGEVNILKKNIEFHKLNSIFYEMLMIGFCEDNLLQCRLLSNESIQTALSSKNLPEIFSWLEISLPENFNLFLLMAYFCINLLEFMQFEVESISANTKCYKKMAVISESTLRNDNIQYINEDLNLSMKETKFMDTITSELTYSLTDNVIKYTKTTEEANNVAGCSEISRVDNSNTLCRLNESNELCTSDIYKDKILNSISEKVINDTDDSHFDMLCNQTEDKCSFEETYKTITRLAVDIDILDVDKIDMETESNIISLSDNSEDKNMVLDIQNPKVINTEYKNVSDTQNSEVDSNEDKNIVSDTPNSEVSSNMSISDTSISNISELAYLQINSTSPLASDNDVHPDLSRIRSSPTNVKSSTISATVTDSQSVSHIDVFSSQDTCCNTKPHLQCFQDFGLFLYLLQKCHTFLLCDVYALYFSLKNKLKDIEITLASRKAVERITESNQTSKSLPLGVALSSTFENGTDIENEIGLASGSEVDRFVLQEEYHVITCHIKKLEEKAQGVTFPNPVSSAVKLTLLYKKLLEVCSCDELCGVLQERSYNAAKWAIQFAVNEDDVKVLKTVL